MGYVLTLSELKPLIEDLTALGLNVVVGAADGEVIFCVYLPHVEEDLQKLWREFLFNYANALKAKRDLPIRVEDKVEWIELIVRTA